MQDFIEELLKVSETFKNNAKKRYERYQYF